jgi:hypothetical protein
VWGRGSGECGRSKCRGGDVSTCSPYAFLSNIPVTMAPELEPITGVTGFVLADCGSWQTGP